MNQSQVEAYVSSLDNVQRDDSYGYAMYFVGDEHMVPFVSIASSDNEYDNISNLNREGVFRINIGVGRETFDSLVSDVKPETVDYSALDVIMPHPEYAKQHFVCILNPSEANEELTKKLIVEAHDLVANRLQRKTNR